MVTKKGHSFCFYALFNSFVIIDFQFLSWILESNWKATEVEIVKDSREFVIVRTKGSTGGFRIRKNKLFSTKEAAEKSKKDIFSSGGHH